MILVHTMKKKRKGINFKQKYLVFKSVLKNQFISTKTSNLILNYIVISFSKTSPLKRAIEKQICSKFLFNTEIENNLEFILKIIFIDELYFVYPIFNLKKSNWFQISWIGIFT
jgi:hypothetical protein